jgi:hypothetical protein
MVFSKLLGNYRALYQFVNPVPPLEDTLFLPLPYSIPALIYFLAQEIVPVFMLKIRRCLMGFSTLIMLI